MIDAPLPVPSLQRLFLFAPSYLVWSVEDFTGIHPPAFVCWKIFALNISPVLLSFRESSFALCYHLTMRAVPLSFPPLLLSLLLAILLSLTPSHALRSSFLDHSSSPDGTFIQLPSQRHGSKHRIDMPRFREAPAFRNGIECLSYGQWMNKSDDLCDPFSAHIAMTLDVSYMRGSMAAILSIVQHSSCPENLVFHFLSSGRETELADRVRSTFPYLRFKVYHFDENLVKMKISSAIRQALEQPLNYARIYIAQVIPRCVRRVIYLDSDVVVVDDIVKLWGTNLNSHPLGAPEYCHANFTKYFTDTFWSDETLSAVFDGRKPCYFNTGVMVMDLERWRQNNYTAAIEQWMEVQKMKRIYDLGSLPPFLLVFGGDVQPVEHRWNQHGLGGDNLEGRCRILHPGPVSLLHWSGRGKPWSRLDARKPCSLDSLWAPYDLFIHPID